MEAYLRYCWCMAEELVEGRWRDIEAVAAALQVRKTLNYEETLEVISPGARALRDGLRRANAAARAKKAAETAKARSRKGER